MRHLILGGARSGKSAHAERLAGACGLAVTYLATAEAHDDEMRARIVHHHARRPPSWGLVEEPLDLAAALRHHAGPHRCLLVDCLTLWLSNLIFKGQAASLLEAGQPEEAARCPLLGAATADLIETLPALPGKIILVSNEVGWGIVPMAPLSRFFADTQGRLNQRVAAVCERVSLVAAGLPLSLKG